MSGNWQTVSKYCIEHRNGNRVAKASEKYVVWYFVNGKYRHGGIFDDYDEAMKRASQSAPDAIRKKK